MVSLTCAYRGLSSFQSMPDCSRKTFLVPILGIRIGWNHEAAYRENINDYEKKRGRQKFNLEIVLTRSEREALLLEWAVDMKTIATSTRAAMKTKFQRKQTLINTRKLSKVEEVIKMTSRRLKNVFLPKRGINGEVDESLGLTSSQIFASDHSGAGDTVSISSVGDNKSHLQVTEPDDNIIENLMKGSFDISTAGVGNEGDDNSSNGDDFTLGATTLGNTSTFSPSVVEIEKFYRELELEMFGEEIDPPSMVGQTLELPLGIESTNSNTTSMGELKIQDEISFHCNPCSNLQSVHLEKYPSRSFRDESQSASYDNRALHLSQDSYERYEAPKIPKKNRIHQHYFSENHYDQPPVTDGRLLPLHTECEPIDSKFTNPYRSYNDSISRQVPNFPIAQMQTIPVARSGQDPNYTQHPSGFYEAMHSQRVSYRQHRRQRGGSFDSSYSIAPRQNFNQHLSPASQLEHAQSYLQPEYIPTATSLDAVDFSFRYSNSGAHYSQRSSHRRSRVRNSGEPLVRYMPMRGSLSANEWMDGTDREPSFCNPETTVTITEGR